jgi:hypothetical protein
MSSLDAKLVGRCQQLRSEIAAVERALPSLEEEIAAELAHLDLVTQEFTRHPFKLLHGSGPERVARVLLGYAGASDPERTRQLVEQGVRANAGPWLRLPAEQQVGKLDDLRAELRRAEAALEINRRQVEAADGSTLPRDDAGDPATWLAVDSDLALIAAGQEVPI